MALIHHWNLQETSGTTVTDSVGSNTGTIVSGTTLGATGPGGSLVNATQFAGTSNTPIDLASDVVLPATSDWSLAFWFKKDVVGDNQGMCLGVGGAVVNYIWNTNNQDFKVQGASSSVSFVHGDVLRVELHHYFLKYNSTTNFLSLYIDGVLNQSLAFNDSFTLGTLGGGFNTTSFAHKGLLSDVRVYDNAASQAEIDAAFAEGVGVNFTLQSVADDQFFQRPATGNLSVSVSGTAATGEVVEYQLDAGVWQTLATAASDAYSGSVSASVGNHSLVVRLASDTSNTIVKSIHIGDAFGWFGQSNADNTFDNPQTYSGSLGFWIYDENDAWIAGVSGYKSAGPGGGTGFSILPRLASQIEALTGVPVAFIAETEGGVGITTGPWGSNPPGVRYLAAVAAINDSGINGLKAAIVDVGESDTSGPAVAASVVETAFVDFHVNIQAAVGLTFPLIVSQTGTATTASSDANIDAVRQGQQAAVDNNAAIHLGVIGYDRANLHWQTDAEATTYIGRLFAAVDEVSYNGTAGTPPRLVAALVSGMTLTLTYDRDLEAATTYTANAWSFNDNDLAILVNAATKTGNRTADLALASAPTSTVMTVSLGLGNAGQGDNVPRGLGGQPALPEVALAISGDIAPFAEVLSIKNVQRVISVNRE